jgi:dTDP-4-dehydrorhamnose 3,5-epimerase
MELVQTPILGAYIVKNAIFQDDRGFFKEIFRKNLVEGVLPSSNFVQENHSRSKRNVLRGMHYQNRRPQGQLVTVFSGEIYEAIIDLRPNSSSFKQTFEITLSSHGDYNQIYTPPGVAGGFLVTSEWADLNYKVTEYYDHDDERGLNCLDPEMAISWPQAAYIMNSRDQTFPNLCDIKGEDFPLDLPLHIDRI